MRRLKLFSGSHIKAYAWNKSANHLKVLELADANLTNAHISFQLLSSLERLTLIYTSLNGLTRCSLSRMHRSLKQFSLECFNFKDLPTRFDDFKKLDDIAIRRCNWTDIASHTFPRSLNFLDICSSNLTSIPSQILSLKQIIGLLLAPNNRYFCHLTTCLRSQKIAFRRTRL